MSREIDLIGGFYRDEPWSAQDTVNWLPVPAQAEGTRSPMKLRGVPGMKAFQPPYTPLPPGEMFYVIHFDGENGSASFPTSNLSRTFAPVVEGSGNPALITTAQAKFGTGSISFRSTGSVNNNSIIDTSPAPIPIASTFRIESFIRFPSVIQSHVWTWMFLRNNAGVDEISVAGFGPDVYLTLGSGSISISRGFSLNQWVHLCVQGSSAGIDFFINGVLRAQRPTASPMTDLAGIEFGLTLDGFVDEIRVAANGELYPSTGFTPPTAPFPPP